MSDKEKGLSKDWLQEMFDRAKLTAMRDLYMKNHPEWRERALTEPFPPEMEQEWIEYRKKQYKESDDGDAIDVLDALLGDDE